MNGRDRVPEAHLHLAPIDLALFAGPGLEAPLRQLVLNAGLEAALIVENVKQGKGAYGYNVATGAYTDLVKDGVLDPAKVTRSALQNAASIAGLLLITECMVTEIPEKKEAPMPNPGMGGMDM